MASNDPAVFQEFQNALRTRDPKTIAMYLTTMRDFVVWLAAQPGGAPFHMELMTETAVCGYMDSLKTAGRAPRTRSNAFHRKVNEAKVFYGSYAARRRQFCTARHS